MNKSLRTKDYNLKMLTLHIGIWYDRSNFDNSFGRKNATQIT
jgi:hypothetical protein